MTDPASHKSGYWFSPNPDKAWAEKFFLTVVPYWFFYNMAMVQMGWLETGTFWNIMQNLLMWVPYCVLLPWFLRRHSGTPWHRSYWFKFNLYMFCWIFFATYFHTEYFFEVLGLRYRFDEVNIFLDSALVGPDEATALAQHMKIPPSMYFNSIVFFIVYHVTAVIAMRRIRTMTTGRPARRRSATRSMPKPTQNMMTAPIGMASHRGIPASCASARTRYAASIVMPPCAKLGTADAL